MTLTWKKDAAGAWNARVEPDARFTLKITPKGDGRWSWALFSGTTEAPMATGVANNIGAAKNTMEQLVKRLA